MPDFFKLSVKPIFSPNQIAAFFGKIEFLFHEDSQYCAVCLKIDYTLKCLGYICTVSPPFSRCTCALRPLNREDTDKCTL